MNPYEDDAPTNVQGPPPPPPPPGRPLNQSQKSAIAAALVGTAALGGAAYGMAQYLNDDAVADTSDQGKNGEATPDPQPPTPPPGPPEPPGPVDPPVPPYVDPRNLDEYTFEDAFRDSRQEMGKGHYFEWHGQLYNTYYKDEWEQMSPKQHNDFLASVRGDEAAGMPGGDVTGAHGGTALAGSNGEIPPPPTVDDVKPDSSDGVVAEAHTDHGAHGQHTATHANITVDAHSPGYIADQAHAVVADAGLVTIDESATGKDGHPAGEPDIVVVDMDGQNVTVIDADHDGHPDAIVGNDTHVVLLDTDHDHVLDTQATYDPVSHQLTDKHELAEHIPLDTSMDSLHQPDMHQDSMFTSHSDFGLDFDNNADITDFT